MTSQPHFVAFQDPAKPLAETLTDFADGLPDGKITFRSLIESIGEQGILLLCLILILPFMTPIPLPGVSNVIGLLVMLLSIGVIMNRVPWLPEALMKREIPTGALGSALRRGSKLVARIERFLRPRWMSITTAGSASRINGVMLLVAAALFSLPASFIPFSNFIPGMAIVLLCAGMLTRDGLSVVLGHGVGVVAIAYFGLFIVLAVLAGQGLTTLLAGTPVVTPIAP